MRSLKKIDVDLNILVLLLLALVLPLPAKASPPSLTNPPALTNLATATAPTPPTEPPPIPEFWLKVNDGGRGMEWSPASINYDSNFLELEMRPSGRPDPAWEELLSLSFEKTPEPLEFFVEKWLASLKKEDPDLRSKQTATDGHLPSFIIACESARKGEMSISRFVQIREGILVLTYRVKSEKATREKLSEWVAKIKKAELMRSESSVPYSIFTSPPRKDRNP